MKALTFFALAVALTFSSGCATRKFSMNSESVAVAEERLTDEQVEHLLQYAKIRNKVTVFFGLPDWASVEEIKPKVAMFLGLPKTVSRESILGHQLVKGFFTDEKRQKFAKIFGLPEGASWITLGEKVEGLYAKFVISRSI